MDNSNPVEIASPSSGAASTVVARSIRTPGPLLRLDSVLLTPWKTIKQQRRATHQATIPDNSEDETRLNVGPSHETPVRNAALQHGNAWTVKPEPIDNDNALLNGEHSANPTVKEEDISDTPMTDTYAIIEEFQPFDDEDIKQAVAALSNPNAKVKKDMEFNYEFVFDRLKEVGLGKYPITLDEATQYHTFSRYYIANLYGGSTVDTFPTVDPEKVAVHGINNFCFPSLDWNPHAPKHPGAPGLFFVESRATTEIPDHRVIVRLKSGVWLYCGTYRFIPSKSLTPFEFQNQAEKVQRRWAKEFKIKKWGTDIVVRIHLRNTLGREPSEVEIYNACAEGERARQIVNTVTEEQVLNAFRTGQEELGVYCMKCIYYDAEWQKFLVEHYANWARKYQARISARVMKPDKDSGSRKKKRAAKLDIANARVKKRLKRAGMDSDLSGLSELESDGSEDDVVMVLDDSDHDEELMETAILRTMARGTRSRPNARDQEPIFVE